MQQIIGVTELQRKFRSYFDDVVRKRTPLILTRGSRPEAVLIPYEDYLRFQQMQESEVLARFNRVWDRKEKVIAGRGCRRDFYSVDLCRVNGVFNQPCHYRYIDHGRRNYILYRLEWG